MTSGKAKTSAGREAVAFPPVFDLPATMARGEGTLSAWIAMNRSIARSVHRLSEETTRFMAGRLEEDFDRQRQILECRSPEDFWKVYGEFADKALRDYSQEAERMTAIANEVTDACSSFGRNLQEGTNPTAETGSGK